MAESSVSISGNQPYKEPQMTHSCSRPSLSILRSSLLAGAASLVIPPVMADPVVAAVIQVDTSCSLVNAIKAANTNTPVNTCSAGDAGVTDTIVLQNSTTYSLNTVNDTTTGPSGLPRIDSAITIQGNGATITRSGTAPAMRLFLVMPGAVLTLDNVTVSNGSVTGHGGGIVNGGTINLINGTTLSGNKASGGYGGGLFNNYTASAVVKDSVISGNVASIGGGLANFKSNVTLTNSTVSGNSASTNGGGVKGGGGIFNYHSIVKVTTSTISGNSAGSSSGGGLLNYDGTVTVTASTISNNSAKYGGGIMNHKSTVSVSNSTVTKNEGTYYGGGLFSDETSTVTLTNCTVTGNSATHAAGTSLFNFSKNSTSTIRLSNTIIANSLGGNACGGEPITDVTSNWFEDNSCGRTGNGDPRLAPLADNGGPTMTHALLKGSGAIDAGDAGVCAAAPVNNLDQRGVTRPRGKKCDIGSFEHEGSKFYSIPLKNGKAMIFTL